MGIMHAAIRRLVSTALFCMAAMPALADDARMRVLILSGANNHDWRETTPVIKTTLEETGKFLVDVEENVGTMKPEAFAPYAVILSNYNTFGKNAPKETWSAETKQAFVDHIAKGNGLVIIHAGSSVFYDWPEFQALACGTWKDGTSHGRIHISRVDFAAEKHPVTEGLAPFWIRDEFWHKILVAPGAKTLATVTPDPAFNGSGVPENILFATETGGGRGFGLFLGHDTTTMKNTAWRTLLQRGTEWAATGKVTLAPAKDWPATREDAERMTR
jgi:type 1 glutamine amidotransferase